MESVDVYDGFKTDKEYVDRFPGICPACNHAIHTYPQTVVLNDKKDGENFYRLQIAFLCPRRECQILFIAEYIEHPEFNSDFGRTYRSGNNWKIQPIKQIQFHPQDFKETIQRVSPDFCRIYNEALQAESLQLSDVAGPGFRKSLEYLMKDYLIHTNPDETETIKRMPLGNIISHKTSDPNIKICADRATWLGNDATHYERIWNNHDLDDLKRLIQLTVNWIENNILTEEYEKSMQK